VAKKEILTLQEVSKYLRVSKDTIYRLAWGKAIPCFKVGGNWRFRKSKIDEWLEKQERKR
jgi:excisionase family DNA binding protein